MTGFSLGPKEKRNSRHTLMRSWHDCHLTQSKPTTDHPGRDWDTATHSLLSESSSEMGRGSIRFSSAPESKCLPVFGQVSFAGVKIRAGTLELKRSCHYGTSRGQSHSRLNPGSQIERPSLRLRQTRCASLKPTRMEFPN